MLTASPSSRAAAAAAASRTSTPRARACSTSAASSSNPRPTPASAKGLDGTTVPPGGPDRGKNRAIRRPCPLGRRVRTHHLPRSTRMNIAVCVKQTPDPAVPGTLGADHTLDRSGKLILDDSDAYGVEMSLQLAEKSGGGEVVLISMAPNGEVSGLRTALAMGAARPAP